MSWEDFTEVFNEKYFNDSVRAAKLEEFAVLTQGRLSVTEYAQKFERLAQFASGWFRLPELVETSLSED